MCIDGEWTEPVPTCQPTCEDPGQPENGGQDEEYEYPVCEGTVIGYFCDDLYEVIGSPSSTCEDGQWTTPPPECQIMCTNPGSPDNGGQMGEAVWNIMTQHARMEIGLTLFQNVNCDTGYALYDTDTETCLDEVVSMCIDGEWTEPVPTCQPTCEDPGQPENGGQDDEYEYNSNLSDF
ncbi:complement decay-accelerating factor-like [Saccoglossus kowalevskii]